MFSPLYHFLDVDTSARRIVNGREELILHKRDGTIITVPTHALELSKHFLDGSLHMDWNPPTPQGEPTDTLIILQQEDDLTPEQKGRICFLDSRSLRGSLFPKPMVY